jgi:hypothetical protein
MASKIMASRTVNPNVINENRAEWKVSPLKRLSKHLFGGLRQKWQTSCRDRQELWRTYDGSAYAHSIPRSVWRRHGAMLMYVQNHKPGQQGR